VKQILPDLELELLASPEMRSRVQDRAYAVRLYSALCNMRWKRLGLSHGTSFGAAPGAMRATLLPICGTQVRITSTSTAPETRGQ
jgi:hypothetical protein